MKQPFLISAAFYAIMVFGTALAFVQPLRKRENWVRWVPVLFVVCLMCMWLNAQARGVLLIASQLTFFICIVCMVNRLTKMSFPADCYCAVWIVVFSQIVYELWAAFRYLTPGLHTSTEMKIVSFVLFSLVIILLLNRTLARWMPQKDIYQIGPRQLSSALFLGALFSVGIFVKFPRDQFVEILPVLVVCQIYCVSLLYLQTELFKKAQMQKDMDALNFLYSQQQLHYDAARQNVQIVNHKCNDLDNMIERVQQYLPEELRSTMESTLTDAMRMCDTMVDSGSIVLDTVLMEKKMVAEAQGIPISCVADGKLLDFMEVADIYAVFSNALDNAIEAVSEISNPGHRLIDVLVYESQKFMVINISKPIKGSLEFEEDLPVTTKGKNTLRGYGLKVMRRAIEKYRGIFTIETADGLFTLRILIPLPKE